MVRKNFGIMCAMKYAIISDIHANESALRHVLADAAAQGVETVVCLGDVVGYGPLPHETLVRVRQSSAIVLVGNHDDAVSGRQGADGFIDLAGDAVKRHREALDADALAWLRALPYTCELEGARAAHDDFTDPKAFNYIDDESSATDNFNASDAQLMFVGHTHVPGFFLTGQSGTVYWLTPQDFTLEDGKRYIVNPGSVGYPRESNGACYSTYVIYDSAERSVRFRQLPFSVASVMQRGTNPRRKAGLVVAAVVLALAAIASALVLHHKKPVEVKTVTVEVEAKTDPALILAEKSLTIPSSAKFVRANLQIDKATGPVDLHVEFKSATAVSLGTFDKTVKSSSKDRIKVPDGAISAHFTVLRQVPTAQPRLLAFDPSAK